MGIPSSILPILVIPNQDPGKGGGHIARCQRLVQALSALGGEAYLLTNISEHQSTDIPVMNEMQAQTISAWRFIVIDGFRTAPQVVHRWSQKAPVVGIDEGGPCRSSFDYLVDILPGPKGLTIAVKLLMLFMPIFREFSVYKMLCTSLGQADKPNLVNPDFLQLPQKRREQFPESIKKVLITFGAEDAQNLSMSVIRGLIPHGIGYDISLVVGPMNKNITAQIRQELALQGIHLIKAPDNLMEYLADYDLVITHYGLTAFEALAAQTSVALVAPTAYHEILGLSTQFYSFGYGRKAALGVGRQLTRQLVQHSIIQASRELYHRFCLFRTTNSFAATLQSWTFPTYGRCPLCQDRSRRGGRILARFPDRTYVRCGRCGITYMVRPNHPPITYDGAYFLEDYKKQYGKTYIEDFPNLIQMAQSRLNQIEQILLHGRRYKIHGEKALKIDVPHYVRLLDIGCAYGPFLAAAKERGWSVMGLDPSHDAVRYAKDHIGVPVLQGLFPETDLTSLTDGEQLDVVSLWYVIEHFPDLGKALKAASEMLKKGGLLAFSTPSGSGISGRARLRSFLEQSPPDHWTILSPRTCGSILARYGFRLVKTVSTGHHPERFPFVGAFAKSKKTVIYRVLLKVSQLFSLGDTFEAYAIKE
ncbi:methyltransferase domain-containing protein [Gracilinema caldarium]|uniref:Methyltransferase type 12 n=1 Tax=Gracilinema caldarium (strain ATCC 51460 / DSM 7334 / H1) TaxID=744872 RepID=F8F0S0_GRAC1|nr:methyltransferase domain-containing protein [Gracilinema caldarium]AEJ19777.1 Methyltransferase type 12 [Gracilinema caldarium DSM 7334]